jgi:hypothetical protein
MRITYFLKKTEHAPRTEKIIKLKRILTTSAKLQYAHLVGDPYRKLGNYQKIRM